MEWRVAEWSDVGWAFLAEGLHQRFLSCCYRHVSSLVLKVSDTGGSTTLLGKVSNSLTVRKLTIKPQSLKLQIKLCFAVPFCIWHKDQIIPFLLAAALYMCDLCNLT